MSTRKIFDGDDNSDVDDNIKTNNEYAKKYNEWRQKEEFNKLKTKYGEHIVRQTDDGNATSSSSSSDDDEDGIELTEQVEKDFYKTLSCLKNKDPRIYDESVQFFHNKSTKSSKNMKQCKNNPIFLRDYERQQLLEYGGKLPSSSDNDDDNDKYYSPPKSPTYVEEQERLRQNVKNALLSLDKDDDNDDDDDNNNKNWGGLFKVREKTVEETKREDVAYKAWLAGQDVAIDDDELETGLRPLKEYWNDPNLEDGEKFLKDYILNKRFLRDDDNRSDYIPTYNEIVHDSDRDLSEDEKAIETQEVFEHKYNFRFEEPDQDFIKRFPRTMENSVRQIDDKRKIKRVERKERKQKEKDVKMNELKELQKLKKQEIEDKIKKLQTITGNVDVAFKDDDIDGDFDPDAHDRRMQTLFDQEFYAGQETDQKPEFPELDEYLEEDIPTTNDDLHCEDDDFIMDCDYNPTSNETATTTTKGGRKKRKRKSVFAKMISEPKPSFNDDDNKTYEEYLDEYYQFDCEDIVGGDIPCRFKYRKVIPNSFGLSIEEILTAKDRELNKWCSLKKMVQHRPDHVEKYERIAFERKSKMIDLKRRILPSLFEDNIKDEDNKMLKKQKSETELNDSTPETVEDEKVELGTTIEENLVIEDDGGKRKKKNKKKKKQQSLNIDEKGMKRKHDEKNCKNKNKKSKKIKNKQNIGISDARLSAYGLNPKKFKNKLKYGGGGNNNNNNKMKL